ncbi:unnamed protein product, partial [Darwinula stevensoni]
MVHTPLKVEFHITAPDIMIHPFRVSPPVTPNIPQETGILLEREAWMTVLASTKAKALRAETSYASGDAGSICKCNQGKDGKENIIHMVKALISKEVTPGIFFSWKERKEVLQGTKICKSNTATSAENFRINAFTWFKLSIATAACYTELVPVYVKCTGFRWFSIFREVPEKEEEPSFLDQPHSSCPRSTQTPELVETVRELVDEDCLVTTRELDEWLDVGKSTDHEVLTQDLQLRNVASVW